jgi:hypothetical protein
VLLALGSEVDPFFHVAAGDRGLAHAPDSENECRGPQVEVLLSGYLSDGGMFCAHSK